MKKDYRQGAVGALLDEYEKAIIGLQLVINDISEDELLRTADKETPDPNCKSVQSVLSHVVRSGYAYAIYIQKPRDHGNRFPERVFHKSVKDYHKDLNDVFDYTAQTLKNLQDNQLEQFDTNKKILTSWGQEYDIEQMMEHAIVHILRHRRQIEKFKMVFRG